MSEVPCLIWQWECTNVSSSGKVLSVVKRRFGDSDVMRNAERGSVQRSLETGSLLRLSRVMKLAARRGYERN